uniref:Apple domain-containing protein n=1 Tax=Parastrongyloides trichosuri TaxID=131310 RepID=A0A0N5A5G9_PARTI
MLLNDLVKRNAILQHMPMFDHENITKKVFVTPLPTVTMKKAFIKRIRKRISKDEGKIRELKIFDKGSKKQDTILKLPVEEEKVNFSALLNNSLTNMGYLKNYDYNVHEIRKLQPHRQNTVQRFGALFNEGSVNSLVNVDNDITQYEDVSKVTSTILIATTPPVNIIKNYFKKDDKINVSRGISNMVDSTATNLPFTVTEAFEREFDFLPTKEDITLSTTTSQPLKDKSLTSTTNVDLRVVSPTKESKQLEELKTDDDRNSYKMLRYSKLPEQHLTFITKSLINGVEENSVKKVISGNNNNNLINLPKILLPSYKDIDDIKRIENTHELQYIDDNHIKNYVKNYAFGSLTQPIIRNNYLLENTKKLLTEEPYIFDIPSPVELPMALPLSSLPKSILEDPTIKKKYENFKFREKSKIMKFKENYLNYYPKDFIPLIRKKENIINPVQHGDVTLRDGKKSKFMSNYNKDHYENHEKIISECFDIIENTYINVVKGKERRINVSEKECSMFCVSRSDCSFVAYHKKLQLCDFYVIEERRGSKAHVVLGEEKKLVQNYGIPFDGINILLPLRNNGGVAECIKKIQKKKDDDDIVMIDSEQLEFMGNVYGDSKMKTIGSNNKKEKNKALGSTTHIIKSEGEKHIHNKLFKDTNILNNELPESFFPNNNKTYYTAFPIFTPCIKGEKIYYIKNEGHQLKKGLSKSFIQRSNIKECQKSCDENLTVTGISINCSSFSYNFIEKECILYEKGSNFKGNDHLIKNENYNHYESICLQELLVNQCEEINKYPIRKKQTILLGYAIDSFKILTPKSCIDKCLTNSDCESISYFHDNEDDNCILNGEYSITDVNSFITAERSNTVDFFSFSNCQKFFPKNRMGVI